MSISKFFTQAAANASILVLAAYENKMQAKKAKYFDINNFILRMPYQSKVLVDAYRCYEFFDIFDYSNLYRYDLMQADANLTLSKMYLVDILNKWGEELNSSWDFEGVAKIYNEIYRLTRDGNYRAIALNALGNNSYFQDDYKQAAREYKKALSCSNIEGNNKIFKNNLINAYRKLAQDLFYQCKYHEAAEKYLKTYELLYDAKIYDLTSISQKLLQSKKFNEAMVLNGIAFRVAGTGEEKANIEKDAAHILKSWGDWLFAEGFFRKSAQKYLKAYEISHNLDYQMLFFVSRAEELRDKKLYYHALEAYDYALDLAIDNTDISTIYFGKSLVLSCLSNNLREDDSVVLSSNSKILEDLGDKKKDFINAINNGNDQEKSELELTQALYNVEKLLYYFPDLNDYAKAADEVKDLLCRTYAEEILSGEVQEYKFETNNELV